MKQISKQTEERKSGPDATVGDITRTGPTSEQTEVILKGEIHTSESDLAEERQLLVDGVDVLVLEGQEEDAEYGLLRGWYATAMGILGLVLFRTLYTDQRILVDLAEAQGAEVVATRTSDAELVENVNPLLNCSRLSCSTVSSFLVSYMDWPQEGPSAVQQCCSACTVSDIHPTVPWYVTPVKESEPRQHYSGENHRGH